MTRVWPTCRFDGCENLSARSCRGWCPMHYRRWYRHGDPSVVKSSAPPFKDAKARLEVNTVPLGECLIWQGARIPAGYGRMSFKGAAVYTHRVAYELAHGSIPEGLYVLHRCDTPACVNPKHLFLGTAADNNRDASQKGRSCFGERNGHAKLTREQVAEIRAVAARGGRHRDIGARYGVAQSQVSRIVRRERWAHV